MLPDLKDLSEIVKEIAKEELTMRFNQVERSFKQDGSVVTEADLAIQARLIGILTKQWPEFKVLGEEMTPEEQLTLLRQPGDGIWCLDPVDGTSNFAGGLPFFCISLALITREGPVLGLVYDPVRDECFTAQKGCGAFLNDQPLKTHTAQQRLSEALAAVDFKRLAPGLASNLVTSPPYASQRYFGSGALEWCWLAAGRFHIYVHGCHKLWDYAAGCLILEEAGGSSETLEGEPVFAFDLAARSVLAAINEPLMKEWQAAVLVRL